MSKQLQAEFLPEALYRRSQIKSERQLATQGELPWPFIQKIKMNLGTWKKIRSSHKRKEEQFDKTENSQDRDCHMKSWALVMIDLVFFMIDISFYKIVFVFSFLNFSWDKLSLSTCYRLLDDSTITSLFLPLLLCFCHFPMFYLCVRKIKLQLNKIISSFVSLPVSQSAFILIPCTSV